MFIVVCLFLHQVPTMKFGCEVGMDAWVGGYVPGVGVAIQLTLPP
jgi:hypothetical protein